MPDLVSESLISEFAIESRDHLEMIEPDLLQMEQERDALAPEIVARIFRAIHSIKGGAGFLAFEKLKILSHAMESVFMLIRDGMLKITIEHIDVLLRGVDKLRMMLEDIHESESIPCEEEIDELQRIVNETKKTPIAQVPSNFSVPILSKKPAGGQFDLESEVVKSACKRGCVYTLTIFHKQDILN